MHSEETSFIYEVTKLPHEIMSHSQYKSRLHNAVNSMVSQRLAVKGELRCDHVVDERMIGPGIPSHQKTDIILRQFERWAADKFTGMFDAQCNSCSHCKIETRVENRFVTSDYLVQAVCKCTAKSMHGATCFDGYVPSSNQWSWQDDIEAVGAVFEIAPPDSTGSRMATLVLQHDHATQDFSFDPKGYSSAKFYGDFRDEPPGPLTRTNADSGYMTEKELKLANAALARVKQHVRATLPTPRPQTPMDDAW